MVGVGIGTAVQSTIGATRGFSRGITASLAPRQGSAQRALEGPVRDEALDVGEALKESFDETMQRFEELVEDGESLRTAQGEAGHPESQGDTNEILVQ